MKQVSEYNIELSDYYESLHKKPTGADGKPELKTTKRTVSNGTNGT
jgi:hypothetical protein